MITINDLHKTYQSTFKDYVLNIEHLEFKSGMFYIILGPNGVGKSTLLKIISNRIKNYQGTVKVEATISFLSDRPSYLKTMNTNDIVSLYDDLYQDFSNDRFEFMMSGLNINRNRKLSKLSKGQLEQVFLSLTLSRIVKYYILDEPFGALDIIAQNIFIEKILSTIGEDSSLILTTHFPYKVQNIFDQAIFMGNDGILKVQDIENKDCLMGIYEEVFSDV